MTGNSVIVQKKKSDDRNDIIVANKSPKKRLTK